MGLAGQCAGGNADVSSYWVRSFPAGKRFAVVGAFQNRKDVSSFLRFTVAGVSPYWVWCLRRVIPVAWKRFRSPPLAGEAETFRGASGALLISGAWGGTHDGET